MKLLEEGSGSQEELWETVEMVRKRRRVAGGRRRNSTRRGHWPVCGGSGREDRGKQGSAEFGTPGSESGGLFVKLGSVSSV